MTKAVFDEFGCGRKVKRSEIVIYAKRQINNQEKQQEVVTQECKNLPPHKLYLKRSFTGKSLERWLASAGLDFL